MSLNRMLQVPDQPHSRTRVVRGNQRTTGSVVGESGPVMVENVWALK